MKTPVEELFDKLWNTDKDKLTWHAILKEALENEAKYLNKKYDEGFTDGCSGCL